MDNPEELLQIARYHTKGEVRREAVKKINQPKHLMQIMQTNSDDTVRAAAVKKLTDPDLLFRIAREETVPEVYREALEILEEQTKIAVVFQENILQPKGKIALRRLKDLAQIYGIEEEILPVLAKGMEKSELVMMVMDVMESSGLAWWAYCWEVTVEALYEISKRRQSREETKSVESAIQTIYRYREDLRPAIESYAWFAHHRLDDRDEYVILPMRFDYPEKKK
ncbi:MAG TPA: hypothetical protein DCY75_05085 [Clostridiales bacterium]|nr:hypothetical protein [Clostridiales bacterium]